jgi:hypothetical protein
MRGHAKIQSAVDSAGKVHIVKANGLCRTVDQLGRLVLPVELRRTLGLSG